MSFPGRALQRAWHLVDAKDQTVGRLASQIAPILKGKHKPTFLPNKDMGDHVVIVNAEKVCGNIVFCSFGSLLLFVVLMPSLQRIYGWEDALQITAGLL